MLKPWLALCGWGRRTTRRLPPVSMAEAVMVSVWPPVSGLLSLLASSGSTHSR